MTNFRERFVEIDDPDDLPLLHPDPSWHQLQRLPTSFQTCCAGHRLKSSSFSVWAILLHHAPIMAHPTLIQDVYWIFDITEPVGTHRRVSTWCYANTSIEGFLPFVRSSVKSSWHGLFPQIEWEHSSRIMKGGTKKWQSQPSTHLKILFWARLPQVDFSNDFIRSLWSFNRRRDSPCGFWFCNHRRAQPCDFVCRFLHK